MADQTMEEFYKGAFHVDKYLNEETMRKELKEIRGSLLDMKQKNASKMTNVLRDQTDAVIMIAEQLQSLYTIVDTLNSPTAQLRTEVLSLNSKIDSSMKLYSDILRKNLEQSSTSHALSTTRSYKTVLFHTRNLWSKYLESAGSSIHVERMVHLYAFAENFYLMTNTTLALPHTMMNDNIDQILSEKFMHEFETGEGHSLRRTVIMYITLKKKTELALLIKENIVKKKLVNILTERMLIQNNDDVSVLYDKALLVLKTDLKVLLTIFKRDGINNPSIALDCFWPVADELLRNNLTSITAAGHANLFFKRFNDTVHFLEQIAIMHGDRNIVWEIESFVYHLKRFDLLVYYEICHQAISTCFESSILQFSTLGETFFNTLHPFPNINMHLKVSLLLYVQLKYLFSHNIFLPILSDQFMKSSVLLVGRYLSWINSILVKTKEELIETQQLILISTLCDLSTLSRELVSGEKSIFQFIDSTARDQLNSMLINKRNTFQEFITRVSSEMIAINVSIMVNHLQNVGSIPRLYRRTNKTAPKEHSPYVADAVSAFQDLHKQFSAVEPESANQYSEIFDTIIAKVSAEYIILVTDVLNSVCRTEESLRRLKNRNSSPQDDAKIGTTSDESKIRLQIKLDVSYFNDMVDAHALLEGKKALRSLMSESGN